MRARVHTLVLRVYAPVIPKVASVPDEFSVDRVPYVQARVSITLRRCKVLRFSRGQGWADNTEDAGEYINT